MQVGKRAWMSRRHEILNSSGFFSMTSRWKALSRLVGLSSSGPSGSDRSFWRTERRYSRVMRACRREKQNPPTMRRRVPRRVPASSHLADGARRQVQNAVAVVLDLGEELRHAALSPVLADDGQNVAEHVRLGDGAVDVRYHHLKHGPDRPQ